MTDTIAAINLTGLDWQDANTLTGIAVGTAVSIQNQSSTALFVATSTSKPALSFKGQVVPAKPEILAFVKAGENKIWLLGSGPVSIQGV